MGLHLNPGDITSFAESAASTIATYNEELIAVLPLTQSIVSEPSLNTSSYSTFKMHMEDHALVAQGLIIAGTHWLEKLQPIIGKLESETLDEDSLQESIKEAENHIARLDVYYERNIADVIDRLVYGTAYIEDVGSRNHEEHVRRSSGAR